MGGTQTCPVCGDPFRSRIEGKVQWADINGGADLCYSPKYGRICVHGPGDGSE